MFNERAVSNFQKPIFSNQKRETNTGNRSYGNIYYYWKESIFLQTKPKGQMNAVHKYICVACTVCVNTGELISSYIKPEN